MSALTDGDWKSDDGARCELDCVSTRHISMRDKVSAVRDTMIVAALQLVFRTAMVLRTWNY